MSESLSLSLPLLPKQLTAKKRKKKKSDRAIEPKGKKKEKNKHVP